MRKSLLDILVDPISKSELTLSVTDGHDDRVISGALQTPEGNSYPIVNGIPRFVLTEDAGQKQT